MDPVRSLIKDSKSMLDAGKPDAAAECIEDARRIARVNRKFAHYLPITEHRRAMIFKTLGQHTNARKCFEHSQHMFDRTDKIGYAIMLRDFGFFLAVDLHDPKSGRKKILTAQRILSSDSYTGKAKARAEVELLVTESFLCRIKLCVNRFDMLALARLKEIDSELRERAPNKPGYQLDNLNWILDYETAAMETNRYLPRALYLSVVRVRNLPRTLEYTWMAAGGQFMRSIVHRIF